MTILELEGLTGLDRATIRYYEREGLLLPDRKENSYRDYSEADLQEVLKIKLLRQLDMPISRIKELQQGSVDFSSVLRQQGANLAKQAQHTEQASIICMEISNSALSYQSLDAAHYLDKLKEAEQQADVSVPFYTMTTQNYREFHPIRRFVARIMDYSIVRILLQFLLIVVLRIRPMAEWVTTLIAYGIPFLCLPLLAWSLSKFGTTPGKWMMGIRVTALNGHNLTFATAFDREWNALRYEYGFGIPIWTLWRQIRSYLLYKDFLILDHDRHIDYHFTYWKPAKKSIFAATCAALILISGIQILDSICPRYRGDDITIEEFAENYNFYAEILESSSRMKPDGTWMIQNLENSDNVGVVIIQTCIPKKPNEPFRFETEGERVTRIAYENSWTVTQMVTPINRSKLIVILTAIMSQKDMNYFKFQRMTNAILGLEDDEEVSMQFENVEVHWKIYHENCAKSGATYICVDKSKEGRVSLTMEIIIHPAD